MVERPWMTALEMQFAVLASVRKLQRMADAPKSVTDDYVLKHLCRSTTFGWSAESVAAVWLASQSIPKDACFDRSLLPDDITSAWWWLDWPIPLPMKYPGNFSGLDVDGICCILLSVDTNGLWNISCGRMSSVGVPFMVESTSIASGVSLDDLAHPDTVQVDPIRMISGKIRPRDAALMRFILAASVWLKQRIAVVTSGGVERHLRKQLAREFQANVLDVKVVQLRRSESSTASDSGTGDPPEWSCRWIVNGHWRNQPYANGEHKLIYILPYVKGPDDKPLRVPKHTVYSVSR